MTFKQFETCPIALTTLTPIHVGCGEVYEPTNFVADVQKKELYNFDPFLVKLSEEQKASLDRIVCAGSFREIYRFYLQNIDLYKESARTVVPFDAGILNNLSALTDDTKDVNRNEIQRQCYCQSTGYQVPYIPGSEVKGAIYTALLDRLSSKYISEIDVNVKSSSAIERHFFGRKINDSPMKLLSISDLHIPQDCPVKRKIVVAERVDKPFGKRKAQDRKVRGRSDKEKKENHIRAPFEVIQKGQFRCFTGSMTVKKKDPRDSDVKFNYQTIREVFDDINRYSIEEFEEEYRDWQQVGGMGALWMKKIKSLLTELASQLEEGNIALIRIGKNTGARNMTLRSEGLPKIRVKIENRWEEKSDATTMFVALDQGNYLPFGWALIERVDKSNGGKCIKLWSEGSPFKANDVRKMEQEELKEQERNKKLQGLSQEQQKVEKLFSDIESLTIVRPGSDKQRDVKKLLDESEGWSVENKKYFAEKFLPLLKAKGLDQGNSGKQLKNKLKSYKEVK